VYIASPFIIVEETTRMRNLRILLRVVGGIQIDLKPVVAHTYLEGMLIGVSAAT
jgi:hypothetical protein